MKAAQWYAVQVSDTTMLTMGCFFARTIIILTTAKQFF